MTLVKIETPELSVIEESKALQIKKTFEPMVTMLETFEESYNSIIEDAKGEITSELSLRAKRLRLDVGKVRIETGKLKDKQKEKIKLEDKAIMGVHNILVWAVSEKEDTLKGIESHFENLEKERIEKLQEERATEVMKYEGQMVVPTLGIMDDDVWKNYINGVKLNHEQKIAAEKKAELDKIEVERILELSRLRRYQLMPLMDYVSESDRELDFGLMEEKDFDKLFRQAESDKQHYINEQEKIRKENERLEKEAEVKRKQELARTERNKKRENELKPYMVFIRCYANVLDSNEKDYQKQFSDIKKGAELQWEQDRKDAREKALQEEKDQKEKESLRLQLEEKEESERKEKQRLLDIELAKKKAEKAASLAPDKTKLLDLSKRIMSIDMPELKAKEANDIMLTVVDLLSKVDSYIKEKVENL